MAWKGGRGSLVSFGRPLTQSPAIHLVTASQPTTALPLCTAPRRRRQLYSVLALNFPSTQVTPCWWERAKNIRTSSHLLFPFGNTSAVTVFFASLLNLTHPIRANGLVVCLNASPLPTRTRPFDPQAAPATFASVQDRPSFGIRTSILSSSTLLSTYFSDTPSPYRSADLQWRASHPAAR